MKKSNLEAVGVVSLRFTRDLIPLTCATLATIGRYFKSSQSNTNNNK